MWAAAVVVPVAAMAIPIALILLAVLFDVLYLGWFLFHMWHEEWAERVGNSLLTPILRLVHHRHPVPHPR